MKKIRWYKPFWISFTRYIRHMSSRMKIPEYLFLGDRKTLEMASADFTLQGFPVTSGQIFWVVALEVM